MRVAVLHDRVPQEGASPDQRDVLVQAEAVCAALRSLGHDPVPVSVSLDLSALCRRIEEIRPALVFNLVESVEGNGRLIHLAPAVMDTMKVPYTGAGTDAVYLTTNKLTTKGALLGAGIVAPRAFSRRNLEQKPSITAGHYIIKSVWEHASIGLEEDSVVNTGDGAELLSRIEEKEAKLGTECFAESYVEGREFNLSLLAAPAGPQPLPAAEIRFESFPKGKRKIVGYRAKWCEDSFEYTHTVRSFDFEKSDQPLLRSLSAIAIRCWDLFDLRGYARVDFRVDADDTPWVLEVNVNPCLSPDAGFAAAAAKAGLSFTGVVERIIMDCTTRRSPLHSEDS